MSEPATARRSDQSHTFLTVAEKYMALVAEEAMGIGHGIAEGAHAVWDGVSSFFGFGGAHDTGADKGKADQGGAGGGGGGDEGMGISLDGAKKHVEEAKKQAGQEATAKAPAKGKPGGASGLHKTNGPDDLVATFGTAAEAGQHQKDITVYYTDGLKKVEKKDGAGNPVLHKGKPVMETVEKDQAELDQAAMKTKKIPVHEKIAPLFSEIFEAIKTDGAWRHILEMPWSYTPRENRNNATEWSIHSWGTAMDVNATTNPNGRDGGTAHQNAIQTYFTSRGFTWLEHSDAMHFQYHDGNAPQITNADLDDIKAGKISGTNVKTLLVDIKNSRAKAVASLAKAKSESSKKRYQARIDRLDEMATYLGGNA